MFQNIAQNVKKVLNEVRAEIDTSVREKETFSLLEQHEGRSINKRLSKLTEEVELQVCLKIMKSFYCIILEALMSALQALLSSTVKNCI